jgi:hypothetical protein
MVSVLPCVSINAGDMEGNFENDLQIVFDDIADGTIVSGAAYSDVEGHHQNPELKMVLALKEMPDRESPYLMWTRRTGDNLSQ